MFQTEFLPILLFAVGTSSAIAVATFLTARRRSETDDSNPDLAENSDENEVYTLRGGHLVEASFVARRRLDRIGLAPDDISKLRHRLSQRFENATDLLSGAKDQGDLRSPSRDGKLQVVREVAGNEVRLEIMSRHSAEPGRRDLHCLDADGEELQLLRANTEVAPFLLWRQNKDGDVIWANKSYLAAATELFGLQRVSMWPIPSLFRSTAVLKSGARNRVVRIQSVANVSDHKDWFDCHITEVDGDALCTAFPADEAVRSEARRQEFTQTLTKTFSDLSIGLAIFDRSRRLALFNPAVCDLTSLPVDFLTSRPSLVGFLDQLREKRVMPEPRDYRAWRNSIADLETAAMNGTYAETWSLPDGQTYRVSGRPHPDGAMALLFEDISAEMSLTRRFRAQLQQSQSIIDSLDEAVAVFSASGELTFSNAAYQALWSDPEEPSITGKTVVEATRLWHKLTVPTPIWGDFRDFAFQYRERDEWTGQVTMRDGRSVACRFVPHKAGSSLAIFHPQEAAGKVPSELCHAV